MQRERRFGIRLFNQGGDQVRADHRRTGEAGENAMRRITEATRPASRSLRFFSAAAGEARGELEGLASRAPAVGRLARLLGPAGLLGGAAVGALVGVAVAARNASREVAEIGDAADRAQFDVGEYEKLRAALILEGQDSNGLESALSSLVRKAGEAQAGIGEAAKVFKALNVSIAGEDGRTKSSGELIREVADAFQKLPDGAARAAAAQRLFEETGRSLVHVLDEGAEGLDNLFERAEDLGLLYGGDLIRSAQQVNAQFEAQAEILGVQLRGALVEIAPKVTDFLDRFIDNLPTVINFLDRLAVSIGLVGESLDQMVARRARLQQEREQLDKIFPEGASAREGVIGGKDAEIAELERAIAAAEKRAAAAAEARRRIANEISGAGSLAALGSGGGAGKKSDGEREADRQADAFERLTKAAELRNIALLDSQAIILDLGAHTAFLTEKNRLLAATISQGIDLDAARVEEIDRLARAYAASASDLDLLKRAEALYRQETEASLSVSDRLKKSRDEIAELLPLLAELTLDHAEAERIAAEATRRAAADILEKHSDSAKFADDLKQGFRSLISGSESAEEAVSRTLSRMADRLLDLALNPVFDQLAASFANIGGGAAGGGLTGLISSFGSLLLNANGNAFGPAGVIPFRNGGVVTDPTFFRFGGVRTGLMGEAGPEAILPLRRGADGRLGVSASSGGGSVVNNINVSVEAGRDAQETADRTAGAVGERMMQIYVDGRIRAAMRPGGMLGKVSV